MILNVYLLRELLDERSAGVSDSERESEAL